MIAKKVRTVRYPTTLGLQSICDAAATTPGAVVRKPLARSKRMDARMIGTVRRNGY
jgi:hypothetical protein